MSGNTPRKRRHSDSGYRAVDIYTTFEPEAAEGSTLQVYTNGDAQKPSFISTVSSGAKGCWSRFWKENWVFLILLGIASACVVMFIDFCYTKLFEVQIKFSRLGGDNFWASWFLWLIYSLFFASLSWASVVFISPHAAGSGIPEMRCILSGVEIRRYLSFKTLVAKVVGLTSAFVAGFSIGKEGPIIHISSIICRQLTRIPFFRHIHQNDATFLEVLSAACAGGVTLAFGSPIGGALFSIEATSSFYLTSNLWKGFFVSATGAVLLISVGELGNVAMFLPQLHKQAFGYATIELISFSILGLIGGILGAVFVKFVFLVFELQTLSAWFKTRRGRFFRVMIVAVACSASTFGFYNYGVQIGSDDHKLGTTDSILNYLINKETDSAEWGLLISLFFTKMILTIFSVAYTGLPAGVYGAGFLFGAIYGRIFGEVLKLIFPSIHPGAYAVIGAASLASSISHTVSTVVIVIELTKEISLLIPVLLAVLISVAICRLLSDSVFDVIIKHRELPLMPSFDLYASYYQTAADVMRTNYEVLNFNDSYGKLATALEKSPQTMFPLVDENYVFLGAVRRSNIERVLDDNQIPYGSKKQSQSNISKLLETQPVSENMTTLPKVQVSDGEETDEQDDGSSSTHIQLEPIHHHHHHQDEHEDEDDDNQISTSGLLAALGESLGIKRKKGKKDSMDSEMGGEDEDKPSPDSIQPTDQVAFVFLSRHTGSSTGNIIEVDSTVMTIDAHSSIFKTHFLFTMLGLGNLFVTSRGKLSGVITRTSLIRSISSMPQSGISTKQIPPTTTTTSPLPSKS